MSMEDLLKALLGDAESASQDESVGAVALPDLLKGILGGATAGQSAAPQGQSSQQGLDIGDILGGILGGGIGGATPSQKAAPQTPAPQQGVDIGDILGGLLGGGATGAGGSSVLGGILGGILGGATGTSKSQAGTSGAAAILGPIVQGLAQKLGLPPAIAQAVVAFALSKLLPTMLGGLTQPAKSAAAPIRPTAPAPAQSQGFNLDDLLDRVTSGSPQRLSASYIQNTGLASELAQKTGLDDNTAAESLQQVFLALGGQMGTAKPSATTQPQPQRTRKRAPTSQPKRKTPPKTGQTWEV
jgi:hypothetical protein